MKITPLAVAFLTCIATRNAFTTAQPEQERKSKSEDDKSKQTRYELWAADQSNSAPGQSSLGVKGSFLWIFDSDDVKAQLNGGPEAPAQSCSPSPDSTGPCDLLAMFPQNLMEYGQDGPTGLQLGELEGFGRLHGVLPDPSGRYVTANMVRA